MHLRTILSATAVAAAVTLCAPRPAGSEEERRIVVAEFEGPGPAPSQAHKAVLEIISDFYVVVPVAKYRVARRRLDIARTSMQTVAKLARKVGADAIVEGELKKRELTLSVREGKSGRVVDRFKVSFQGRGFSDATRERIVDELVDLIDWTEPLERGGEDLDALKEARPAGQGDEAAAQPARVSLAVASERKPPPPPKQWAVEDGPTEVEARTRKAADRRPPAIQGRASVGVAATARQLSFSHQVDLAENQRPLGMSGSPSAGVAFAGTFDVAPLGVAADLTYKRSIGASVSYPSAGMPTQRSVALSHIGARLMVRRAVSQRLTLRGGAGYNQLSFTINNKPLGLLIPDSRYAYLEVVGGARLGMRDDRIALTGDLSYLFVLAAGGITDHAAYGSSRFQGFGGEVGLEIGAGDNTFVRVAGTYQRIILAFNGDGALATGLDESSDVDVSGAADTYIGWVATFGFRL